MPTYEYKCSKCGHDFEIFQSMSDEPVKVCEKCGSEVRKVFGSAGIIFKGAGFYVNDYKSKDASPAPSESAPACASCSAPCAEAGH